MVDLSVGLNVQFVWIYDCISEDIAISPGISALQRIFTLHVIPPVEIPGPFLLCLHRSDFGILLHQPQNQYGKHRRAGQHVAQCL